MAYWATTNNQLLGLSIGIALERGNWSCL